ncbi:MAG: hypothetical protein R3C68_11155 [Myxococcota bacterium]
MVADPERLSPFDYYQYWVNSHDDDVAKRLGYFTFLPMAEIRQLANVGGAELNMAKSVRLLKRLASYGETKRVEAHRGARHMAGFGAREIPASVLPSSQVPRQASTDVSLLPTTQLQRTELAAGPQIIELMVQVGMANSIAAARRLIDQERYGSTIVKSTPNNSPKSPRRHWMDDKVFLYGLAKRKCIACRGLSADENHGDYMGW